MKFEGTIISGEFDKEMNEFDLQEVKSFSTQTILKEKQFNDLYEYLTKHQNEMEGQVLTLYDQMPVYFTKIDMNQLIEDLSSIKPLYN